MSDGVITLAIIAAILGILLLLRLGVDCVFEGKAVTVRAQVGLLRFTVYTTEKRGKKRPKKAPKKAKKVQIKPQKEPVISKEKKRLTFSQIKELVSMFGRALRRILRGIRLDELSAEVFLGGDEPAKLAELYGKLSAGLGTVHALIDNLITVRRFQVRLEPDFCGGGTRARGRAHITIAVYTIIAAVIGLAASYLRYTGKTKKAAKEQRGGENERREAAHSQRGLRADNGENQANG